MDTLKIAADILNGLSPLAVIGLLGYVIFLLVSRRGPIKTISDNHLSGLPEMHETLRRMEASLNDMRDHVVWIRARINGRE